MCNIQPVLVPDAKLSKMLVLSKIFLFINIAVGVLRLVSTSKQYIVSDLMSCLFLFYSIFSVLYICLAIYIVFNLINSFILCIDIATYLQMLIQHEPIQIKNYELGITLFIFIFYISTIFFHFPIYKEMKAQLLSSMGLIGVAPDMNSRLNNRQDEERAANPNTNNNRSFNAFSGRGVAVGGN